VQLIIAEKPSVARDLARVLGVRPAGQHAFEGERCVITWCVGHLVELEEPAAYDSRWRAWRLDSLPMLPDAFRLRAAGHAGPQLRAVVQLLRERRFRSVINACDAGREGELIFRYVVQYAGASPPVQRLWISSLTDDAIRRGLGALRPGGQLDALGDAARSRSEADWLVGMNATRAITARGREGGQDVLYSIGRVQTPTLAMLVHREQAIRAFVPRPYWEVHGKFAPAGGTTFAARWRRGDATRLATAQLADAIIARDRSAATHVEKLRARTVKEPPPPLLFDLTALQRTANRRFGFSAARTLELAQALYERHKLLTYPRTDARHLSTDVARELAGVFDALAAVPEYAELARPLLERPPRPGRRIVDDSKVHDHHAIIPTPKPARLEALDRDERRLFDLVARRFLAAFYPDAEFAVTDVWIRVGAAVTGESAPAFPAERPAGAPAAAAVDDPKLLEQLPAPPDRYFARGRVRVQPGWQAVAGIEDRAQRDASGAGGEEGEPVATLPALVEGQPLDATYAPIAKQTTPPPRYTEASLLGAMEAAGKTIDDEALRLAMKDTGLGTPATRAAIIETLLRRDYLERSKQHLVPTALGVALIETLPVASLASPELTGAWEARLARIARGNESRDAFMADIAAYVTELVDAIRGAPPPVAPAGAVGQARAHVGAGSGSRTWQRGSGGSRSSRGSSGSRSARGSSGSSDARGTSGSSDARGSQRKPLTRKSSLARKSTASASAPRSSSLRSSSLSSSSSFDRSSSPRSQSPRSSSFGSSSSRSSSPRSSSLRSSSFGSSSSRSSSPRSSSPRSSSFAGSSPRSSSGSSSSRSSFTASSSFAGAQAPTSSPAPARSAAPSAEAIDTLTCPRCRAGSLLTGSRGWGCSRWREGCTFVIWFETCGRRLSAAQLRDLVTRGKTRKAKFRAPSGALADGKLVLDLEAERGNARFEPA
jgi:DNA topoisomerase-3